MVSAAALCTPSQPWRKEMVLPLGCLSQCLSLGEILRQAGCWQSLDSSDQQPWLQDSSLDLGKLQEQASQMASGKESTCQCRRQRRWGSVPGSGRSLGEGNDNPLQYSCLENPMDRGAWQAPVHGVTKSQTWLSTHTRLRTELSSKFSLTILLFSFYSISLGWDGIPNLLLPLFLSQVFFIINWLQSHSLLASASYKNKTERKKKKNTTKQNTNFLKISQHLDLRLPLTHLWKIHLLLGLSLFTRLEKGRVVIDDPL